MVSLPVRYEKNHYFPLAAFNYAVRSIGEEFEVLFWAAEFHQGWCEIERGFLIQV